MNIKETPEESVDITVNQEDDAFFSSLVDQIPAQFYFDQETVQELKKKIKDTTNVVFGDDSKSNVGQSMRHKFAKFNPSINKSVLRILEELNEEQKGIAGKKNRKIKKDKLKMNQGTLHSAALDRASSIEALQRNLRDKIEKMRNGRNLEQIRARRDFEKMKKNHNKNRKSATGNQVKNGKPAAADEVDAQPEPQTEPGFTSDGQMVFSKFDFSNSEGAKSDDLINNRALKKATNVKGLKGFKKQLHFVEEKQRKLEELKQSDPAKAAEVEEKSAWLNAIDKTRGIKKKDNAELLKKTIKKREKMKERSTKKWTARQETVRKQQEDRQNKRKANLQGRRESKVKNKLKKMARKGRVINTPGF